MNSWGGATFVLVVETINLSKGVFNTNSLEASSTCPGNNKSKTFWLRLVCMQCLLEWCILRHWSRHVTTSKDKKNSLLENEFAIRKFPCLKSRRAIFNVGQISFLQSRARWLTEIRPTFLWTSSATAKQRAAVLGAYIVDNWQDATVHVVDSFESPGQRVSWASKLGGHLIVTRDLQDGPWIQFPNCKFHLNSLIARHVSVTFNLQLLSVTV